MKIAVMAPNTILGIRYVKCMTILYSVQKKQIQNLITSSMSFVLE